MILYEGFEDVGKCLVEGFEGSVVEADNRTDRCSRFMYLGLSVELRPSGVKVPHLFKEGLICLIFFE